MSEAGHNAHHRPAVIAHRGASGYRPEHTVASYELAARMGADFLEPDLVSTADGVLVCRHEPEISQTTDVSVRPEFTDRRTTRQVDGRAVTGWFADDFSLAELKTLRAVERLPALRPGNTFYNGWFEIPTFAELLELRARLSAELGRAIGVYPETKHPMYFAERGLALEPKLVQELADHDLTGAGAPVFVQSFEVGNLRALRAADVLQVPFVQLIDDHGGPYDLVAARPGGPIRSYADLRRPRGLTQIAQYAQAIGAHKDLVLTRSGKDTGLVTAAHDAGLAVHVWTCRAENAFLPKRFRRPGGPAAHGDATGELTAFADLGVDAIFTDFADLGVAVRDAAT